jgi:hypothetical protein
MVVHLKKRYCFTDPAAENGDEFVECNLEQLVPNTPVMTGKTGLVFRECRLINCQLPVGSVVAKCNTRQINFCTNIHPERVGFGQTAEVENCPHVIGTDILEGEGGQTITIYHYEDEEV